MSEIGALSSYALAMQQLQLNIVKQNAEMQQQIVEVLLDPERTAPVSTDKGTQVDLSI